jgi:predicted Zn-dependent protease
MRRILTTLVACAIAGALAGPPPSHAQAAQPPDPVMRAVDQIRSGRYTDGVAALEAAMRANARAGEPAYLLLAQVHVEMADAPKALDTLRAGLRVYPSSPALEGALGQLLFRIRFDDNEAGVLLARTATKRPRDPGARHYYAQWAYLNGQERVCITQEQQALTLPGLNDLAELQMHTLLGLCHSRFSDAASVEGARRAFERAHAINTRRTAYDPVASLHYVQFLVRQGDTAPAQVVVEQILARAPNFGPARLEAAKHLDRNGECETAIEAARLALASDGIDINSERAAHLLMARCHTQLGNTAEAEREQLWIEQHPNPETPRTPPKPGA